MKNKTLFASLLLAALPALALADHHGKPHGMDCCMKEKPCCKNKHAGHAMDGACKKMLKNKETRTMGMAGDMGDMGHMGHAMGRSAAPTDEATQALDAAMADMHKAMAVPYTGNPDIDFLRGMIPHHQGAVEMAKIQIKYGKDARLKKLSYDIIRAQKLEIDWMQRWLKELDARQVAQ